MASEVCGSTAGLVFVADAVDVAVVVGAVVDILFSNIMIDATMPEELSIEVEAVESVVDSVD